MFTSDPKNDLFAEAQEPMNGNLTSVLHFGLEIKVQLVIKQKRNNAAVGVQLV